MPNYILTHIIFHAERHWVQKKFLLLWTSAAPLSTISIRKHSQCLAGLWHHLLFFSFSITDKVLTQSAGCSAFLVILTVSLSYHHFLFAAFLMAKGLFSWGVVKRIYCFDCHNAVFLPPGTFYLVMQLQSVHSHLLHSLVLSSVASTFSH